MTKKRVTVNVIFIADLPSHAEDAPVLTRSLTAVLSEWLEHNFTSVERDPNFPLMTVNIQNPEDVGGGHVVDLENPSD